MATATLTKTSPARTCCDSHADNCLFGRQHSWSVGWIGGPKSGLGVGEPGWHDSAICVTCKAVCIADLEQAA